MKVKTGDGKLKIVQEGRAKKFIRDVEQITFNGKFSAEQGKEVLYITERCVFSLTDNGLKLSEVAPGIDIEKDILANMDFKPIIDEPALMEKRIFETKVMKLRKSLLEIPIANRLVYDKQQNIVFANMSGLDIATKEDLEKLSRDVNKFFKSLGHKVNIVTNHDGISIAPRLASKFANLLSQLEYDYYLTATRYTTSAFLRQKLGEDLKQRSIQPHIFESKKEASDFIFATRDDI